MTDQQHRFALEFLEQLPLDGFDSVLDIGAGPGFQTQWFIQQGKDAKAVDLCPPRVDVPWVNADAHTLPFNDASVDAVWTHHAFEHIRDPLGALLEASRVLKPGGYLFFTVPDTDGVVSNGHINRYDMPLVVYHLAMCGFDTLTGCFGKFRSHLRAVVRKIDTPDGPCSVRDDVMRTGRFRKSSLVTKWLDGSTHNY